MGIAADLSLDEKILENIAIELILDQIQLALEISSKCPDLAILLVEEILILVFQGKCVSFLCNFQSE